MSNLLEDRNDEISRLARRALEGFGLDPGAELTFVNYRENHVFRVSSGGTEWALKLHRPGYRSDSEIASEAAILESLSDAGLRVTQPVRARDGGHLVRIPVDGGLRQATLQRWLPDTRALGDSSRIFTGLERPTDTELEDLGELMAQVHAHTESVGAPAGYNRRAWDARGLVGPDALWGTASQLPALGRPDRAIIQRAEARLALELSELPMTRNFGPIHADLTMENVLADETGLALIDFDDSGEGWFLFDLATAYFFFSGHPQSATMLVALTDGYQHGRQLTSDDLAGWHPLLLARAFSYLGWSVDRPGDPATIFHEEVLLPRILEAAATYIESGRTGWDEPHLALRTAPESLDARARPESTS